MVKEDDNWIFIWTRVVAQWNIFANYSLAAKYSIGKQINTYAAQLQSLEHAQHAKILSMHIQNTFQICCQINAGNNLRPAITQSRKADHSSRSIQEEKHLPI